MVESLWESRKAKTLGPVNENPSPDSGGLRKRFDQRPFPRRPLASIFLQQKLIFCPRPLAPFKEVSEVIRSSIFLFLQAWFRNFKNISSHIRAPFATTGAWHGLEGNN